MILPRQSRFVECITYRKTARFTVAANRAFADPYSVQHCAPADSHCFSIIGGQNLPSCPPQSISACINRCSSHGPPGEDFVLRGYFSPPGLPGQRASDKSVLLPPSEAWGSCRIGAGGCKTDCQAAAKHLRSLSSPQHYPIPHFPRLFRRDRLIFSGQRKNKKGFDCTPSQIPFYRPTEER